MVIRHDWLFVLVEKKIENALKEYILQDIKYTKLEDSFYWIIEDLGNYSFWKFYKTEEILTRLSVLITSFNSSTKLVGKIIQFDRHGEI